LVISPSITHHPSQFGKFKPPSLTTHPSRCLLTTCRLTAVCNVRQHHNRHGAADFYPSAPASPIRDRLGMGPHG
jgi:hypothetical protein